VGDGPPDRWEGREPSPIRLVRSSVEDVAGCVPRGIHVGVARPGARRGDDAGAGRVRQVC